MKGIILIILLFLFIFFLINAFIYFFSIRVAHIIVKIVQRELIKKNYEIDLKKILDIRGEL